MQRPFTIFPSVGYKNSQFQIVSELDNLKIEIFKEDKKIETIYANSDHPTVLTNLKETGKLIAKCAPGKVSYEQEIEIKEAIRLGTSEYKKIFVFDDTEYSFILMKDRLLLYNENKNLLLTENNYSPSEIYKLNKENFLFVTRIGEKENGIVNYGIYNARENKIESDLLNDYKEIKLLPEKNLLWVYERNKSIIKCYELIDKKGKEFSEIIQYNNFLDYTLDDSGKNLIINKLDKIIFQNFINIKVSSEIKKQPNNSVDKWGNECTTLEGVLIYKALYDDNPIYFEHSNKINLSIKNLLHVGENLTTKTESIDYNKKAEKIKETIVKEIEKGKTRHYKSVEESKKTSNTTHVLLPTHKGIYLIEENVEENLDGYVLNFYNNTWNIRPDIVQKNKTTITYINSKENSIIFESNSRYILECFKFPVLNIIFKGIDFFFSGKNFIIKESGERIEFLSAGDNQYLLKKSSNLYSLFKGTNLKTPILDEIKILNLEYLNSHKSIFYSINKNNKTTIDGFNLEFCLEINMNIFPRSKNIFTNESQISFSDHYAITENNILFNPITYETKDAFVGELEVYSKDLNKIASYRGNRIYLSKFSGFFSKYQLIEIPIEQINYRESYLSPDGNFLILQDDGFKYQWYDLKRNETINFINGNFLGFRKDGNLIVEEDRTRAVKIIDPISFKDITPTNYHHFRFLSPDGKLYAQVATKIKYINTITEEVISEEELQDLKIDLNTPPYTIQNRNEFVKYVSSCRTELFNSYQEKFKELGIETPEEINTNKIIKEREYTEIGIVGKDISIEILFPEDIQYYNYAAFSYDNKYFGYVGKPSSNGLIHLFKIKFDEKNSTLSIIDTYLSRYPRYASWVCGFSKTGYFATYDSAPDTYIIEMGDEIFNNKPSENDLIENIQRFRSSIYSSFSKWNEIKGKNFLCFSPSGEFLALSERGYEPLSLGGYGHQESSMVHIAKTKTGEIVDSFNAHGDIIKEDIKKKVNFVAFSEDESKLMTMSKDGVVIIRDIDLKNKKSKDEVSSVSKVTMNKS